MIYLLMAYYAITLLVQALSVKWDNEHFRSQGMGGRAVSIAALLFFSWAYVPLSYLTIGTNHFGKGTLRKIKN